MNGNSYKTTKIACYISYIVSMIVNNFAPLLYVHFQTQFEIPLEQITMISTANFGTVILITAISPKFIDYIGYKRSAVLANLCDAIGLLGLVVFPRIFPSPGMGLIVAACIYGIGNGMYEILLSPIITGCITDPKEKDGSINLLMSFSCWGQVLVVLITTIFFAVFGLGRWEIAAVLWAIVPITNALLFAKNPVPEPGARIEEPANLGTLLKNPLFWLCMVIIMCAGSGEQAVCQWGSTFMETSLNMNKTIGDLAGPMSFAVFEGLVRVVYTKFGLRWDMRRAIAISAIGLTMGYLCIALSPSPILVIVGFAICGCAVSLLWPGAICLATSYIPNGSTVMFSVLALTGAFGCTVGPSIAGMVAAQFENNVKYGILATTAFPVLCVVAIFIFIKCTSGNKGNTTVV